MVKMKRVVLLTMIVLILSACSKNDSSPSGTTGDSTQNNYEETQPVWRLNEFTASQDGFYYRLGDFNCSPSVEKIYYFDKETHEQYPVCSKPECQHNDESCTAVLGWTEYRGGIWYYADKLYLVKNSGGYTWLYRMDTDGSNREKLFEIGDWDYGGANTYYLYFRDDNVYIICTHIENGQNTFIRKRSLDGKVDEMVYENMDEAYMLEEELQWYSSGLYMKEYIYNTENMEDSTQGTRLVAYDFDTNKTEYIDLGNFSGYCFSKDERYCYFYRINDGLYRRDMKDGKEKKLYESPEGYNLFDMRCIGNYIIMTDLLSVIHSDSGKMPSVYVIDNDGNLVRQINGFSRYDNLFFGNEEYIFARGLAGDRGMIYAYIKMADIETVDGWTLFQMSIMGQ